MPDPAAPRTRRSAARLAGRAARSVLAPVLLAAAALLGGCGRAELPVEHWLERLGHDDAARRDEAVVELGRMGRADPGRVVPPLIALLERERGQRLTVALRVTPDLSGVLTDADRARTMTRLVGQLRQRARLLGRALPQVRVEGERIDLVVVPPEGAGDLVAEEQLLIRELSRTGEIEVLAELPAPFEVSPERPVSPWGGDAASYAAWIATERAQLEAAQARGTPYEPRESGRGLVPRGEEGEGTPRDPVPVQLPLASSLRFTEQDLEIQPRDDPQNGTPSLFVSSGAAREADWRAFLRANAGLRLWLVLDGEAVVSARLLGQPGPVAVFPVRGATLEAARTRAARLVARAALGRYPVPLSFQALERAPVISADEPVARALVEVGLAAEPALDALAAKDASWVSLVQRLKADIVKGETRVGR